MFQGFIDQDTAIPVAATAIQDVLFERGLYWASGRSGVVNLVAAHKWFNLAALKGRADAITLRREVDLILHDDRAADHQVLIRVGGRLCGCDWGRSCRGDLRLVIATPAEADERYQADYDKYSVRLHCQRVLPRNQTNSTAATKSTLPVCAAERNRAGATRY